MTTEIRVPALPESVSDATLVTWHKQPGDVVKRDDNLLDLETDKVVLEVPASSDGVLGPWAAAEGEVVSSDQLLGVIEPVSATATAPATPANTPSKADSAPTPASPQKSEPAAPTTRNAPAVLTPAVRRLVKELSLDSSKIIGTGKDGRILKSDVMAYLDQQEKEADADIQAAIPGTENTSNSREESRVPMSRLRARVAERLVEAQQNAAILTTFNEVDLTQVMALRARYKEPFEQAHGVRLGMMSFFVKATIEALKRYPVLNASVDGQDILYHNYFDIGIAVGSPRGLVVPIVRDADQKGLAELEQTIRQYGGKARDGSLSYDELSGGTFTVSNGGVYGSMLSTPILNPPQSAILGMHNITERPIVVDGEIVIRPMMYLALSYDHRIIDGKEAVEGLVCIKQALEDPARLLLNI